MPKILKFTPDGRAVPNFRHPKRRGLKLFVQDQGLDKGFYWYCRAVFSHTNVAVRSLKLPYIPQDQANQQEAEDKAIQVFDDLDKRVTQGFSIKKKIFATVANALLEDARVRTAANIVAINKGLDPYLRTVSQEAFWNAKELELFEHVIEQILLPYFDDSTRHGKGIETYNTRDVVNWSNWRIENQRDLKLNYDNRETEINKSWAPDTLNRQNRVLRTIFRYALDEALIDNIPHVQNFKTELIQRTRPEMSQSQYNQLLSYFESRYRDVKISPRNRTYQRYLYLWIATLDASGIRPWKGKENAMKWDDIDIAYHKDGSVKHIVINRVEKDHSYEAVADEHWIEIYHDLKKIHEAWDIQSEYVWAHPESFGNRIKKNAPILSFRTQWMKAMNHFGWASKGSQQKDRISPYSIRHRYARRRLLVDSSDPHYIEPIRLAHAMGTSLDLLSRLYISKNAKQDWAVLTKEGYKINPDRIRLYDNYGNVMKYVDRDSIEHKEWYAIQSLNNLGHALTEKPSEWKK